MDFGVVGDAGGSNAAGVLGRNTSGLGHGVRGEGAVGVAGATSVTGNGAVCGAPRARMDFGVVGDAGGSNAAGVLGRNTSGLGHGVRGEGAIGVYGSSTQTGFAAVAGAHQGVGYGVVGDAGGGVDTAGVLGRHALATGVRGEGAPGVSGHCTALGAEGGEPSGGFAGVRGKSEVGPGVFGTGRYGGQFKGTAAQLSLVPGSGTGPPTQGNHAPGRDLPRRSG